MSAVRDYLPWLLSAITIWMTVLAGNKHRLAWPVGLVNQALWLVWIVASSAWGLLPMNLALWVVYGRNHLKWMGDDAPASVLPKMRSAFRTTVSHGPEGLYEMRFKFGNLTAMHEADAEWRAHTAAPRDHKTGPTGCG